MMQYMQTALHDQAAGTAMPFVMIERSTGNVIGCTRFHTIVVARRRLEIGLTWIGRPWQRTAVNTEAKYLMLRHAFEQMGCLRVELKAAFGNERSRRAILRLGATQEGILRHYLIFHDQTVSDAVQFSIIAPEWPAVKERLETKLRTPR